jgi:hypothetical protein
MKNLFKTYEELSNSSSIVRFLKFAELNFSKTNFNKLNKLYKEFEQFILSNDFQIKKSYINFRNYCLVIKTE